MAALLEWTAIAVGSLFLALLLRTMVVQSYYIPSGSMEHTLTIDDRVLVNKMSYQFGDCAGGGQSC
ncbi:MAG: S26 family signal peptidase [Acidimicrobiales bacterium]